MPISQKRFTRLLHIVVAVGLLLRSVVVMFVRNAPVTNNSDSEVFVQISRLMLQGKTDFSRAPGYPFFLSLIARAQSGLGLNGVSITVAAGVIQALLGAASVLLLAKLVERRIPDIGRQVALIAALFYAVSPGIYAWSAALMTEALVVPLFITACAVLFWKEQPSIRLVLLAGALLGSCVLVRNASTFLILGAVIALKFGSSWKVWIYKSGLLVLASLLVIGSWVFFAHQQTGRWFLVDTTSDQNLCLASSDHATGSWNQSCPAATTTWGFGEAINWSIEHPSSSAKLRAKSLGHTLLLDNAAYFSSQLPNYINPALLVVMFCLPGMVGWILTLIGGMVGAYRGRRLRFVQQFGAISVATLVAPTLTFGDNRFHATLMPFLYVALAYWLSTSPKWPGRLTARAFARLNPPDHLS